MLLGSRAARCALSLALTLAACAPSNLGLRPPAGDAAADAAATKDTGTPATPDAPAAADVYVDVPVVIDPDQPVVDAATPADATARDAPAADVPPPLDAPTVDAGALPNLIPVISNPQIQERTFAAGACEVMEGCTVAGNRRLLRFDLTTPNVGAADLIAQLLLGFTHRVPTVGEGVKHRLLAGGARRTPHATARRPTAATSRLGDRACADRSCFGGHPEPVHIARFGHLDHARRTRERRAHAQPHEQVATRAGRQRQRHGQRQPQPQPQQH
jgi:hypothetical protein